MIECICLEKKNGSGGLDEKKKKIGFTESA